MGEMGGGEELSLSLSSLPFRFHLSPFPPETPDTQASCTGGIHVNQELSVYRFFNHTENENFMAFIHTDI